MPIVRELGVGLRVVCRSMGFDVVGGVVHREDGEGVDVGAEPAGVGGAESVDAATIDVEDVDGVARDGGEHGGAVGFGGVERGAEPGEHLGLDVLGEISGGVDGAVGAQRAASRFGEERREGVVRGGSVGPGRVAGDRSDAGGEATEHVVDGEHGVGSVGSVFDGDVDGGGRRAEPLVVFDDVAEGIGGGGSAVV